MSARHILIVYGTRHGQTAAIASRIRELLSADGFSVTLADVAHLPRVVDLARFDAVLVGASVIAGKHQRAVQHFVIRYLATLEAVPSAFFSVSGSAASPDPRSQAEARRLMADFLARTGWHPDLKTTVAGAMAYTKYSPLTRWVVKQIARRAGGPTDTTRDHEFTDWDSVEKFAHSFGRLVAPAVFDAPDALAGV
jgi:menaquinone-dependent protoporphyrinogen oxidase